MLPQIHPVHKITKNDVRYNPVPVMRYSLIESYLLDPYQQMLHLKKTTAFGKHSIPLTHFQ